MQRKNNLYSHKKLKSYTLLPSSLIISQISAKTITKWIANLFNIGDYFQLMRQQFA